MTPLFFPSQIRVKQKRLARLRRENGVKPDLFTSNLEIEGSGADSGDRANGSNLMRSNVE
jgi:hypothetical protein